MSRTTSDSAFSGLKIERTCKRGVLHESPWPGQVLLFWCLSYHRFQPASAILTVHKDSLIPYTSTQGHSMTDDSARMTSSPYDAHKYSCIYMMASCSWPPISKRESREATASDATKSGRIVPQGACRVSLHTGTSLSRTNPP